MQKENDSTVLRPLKLHPGKNKANYGGTCKK